MASNNTYIFADFICMFIVFLYVLGITKFAVPNTDKHPLLQMHCDDDLQDWLTESWSLMIPLLCSLGCAILIEIILVSRYSESIELDSFYG